MKTNVKKCNLAVFLYKRVSIKRGEKDEKL